MLPHSSTPRKRQPQHFPFTNRAILPLRYWWRRLTKVQHVNLRTLCQFVIVAHACGQLGVFLVFAYYKWPANPLPTLHLLRSTSIDERNDTIVPYWAPDRFARRLVDSTSGGPIIASPVELIPVETKYPKKEQSDLMNDMVNAYLESEKGRPYVGHPVYAPRYEKNGDYRKYLNSLAVFPEAQDKAPMPRMHGLLGVTKEGRQAWHPSERPPPIDEFPGGLEAALKHGGFYLNLSSALPLDRDPTDARESVCKKVEYNLDDLPDASVVITFYNEPLSTLLRTCHSVLNLTPPPLLREIILVDDHSDMIEDLPGGPLDEYIKLLPKVKLLRLPERRGLVHARLAGARAATGSVLVVLDSHVEVNYGWLEPQLQRIKESPYSVVFPQILSLNPSTFEYDSYSGIGCELTFKWSIVEQSSLTATVSKPDAIPSASMAGGLFAVDLDWFWELGGYDEGFTMWGAENVEMGFRTWLCGGRLECTPCARTYHIYRHKGVGYSSPPAALNINKLRTAKLWTDEYFDIARIFIGDFYMDKVGNFDKMLALKERLGCRKFDWFLENVDPKHEMRNLSAFAYSGAIRSVHPDYKNWCIDTLSNSHTGDQWGTYWCHGEGGTQGYVMLDDEPLIRTIAHEELCLSDDMTLGDCKELKKGKGRWELTGEDPNKRVIAFVSRLGTRTCLTIQRKSDAVKVMMKKCGGAYEANQLWSFDSYKRNETSFEAEYSEKWRKLREHQAKWRNNEE